MREILPYEVLDRSHWPKESEAPGYEVDRISPDDATARTALGSFFDEVSAGGLDWNAELERGSYFYAARTTADGRVDAVFAVQEVPVRVAGERRSWGRMLFSGARETAAAIVEPPLLVRVAHRFYARHGTRDELPVVFGAPGFEAMLLGRKPGVPGHALKYAVVRTESVLRLEAGDFAGRRDRLPDFEVECSEGVPAEVPALAERLTSRWEAALVRGESELPARYPAGSYRTYLRRDSEGEIKAAAIVREADWPWPRSVVVADWICEDHDYESGLAVVRGVLLDATERSVSGICVLIPDWLPWFHHFQWHGFLVHPVETVTIARTAMRTQDAPWLRDRFFYTAGDLGLV